MPEARSFGICIGGGRGDESAYGGCELQFFPHLRRVQWDTPTGGTAAGPLPTLAQTLASEPWQPIWDNNYEHLHFRGGDLPIENVEGIDRPFDLELVVKYDAKSRCTIIDACIDCRRTMITRRLGLVASRLFLFAESGALDVAGFTVRPIAG
ncbi:MAG TPA: hypothetical protein VK324_04180 [Tepidisphaeraceae bacterium]|nr:hypothetical protein [Tepidisphaeraceae bacterium]